MPASRLIVSVVLSFVLTSSFPAWGQELQEIRLPSPQLEIGKSLMRALLDRATSRSFSTRKLPIQTLSNLLWAAFGINRPDSGKRTAPSTFNWQEIDIYAALSEGLFLYDAKSHSLIRVLKKDIRSLTGHQSFVKQAPLNLIYVADLSKTKTTEISPKDRDFYIAADTGFISENVYLYCASEGLGTVVRGLSNLDRKKLMAAMKLRLNQKIILAQTVGYQSD